MDPKIGAVTIADCMQNSKNFVVALIDGDGAIFQDWRRSLALVESRTETDFLTVYQMGRGEGGAEAAHQLHTELQKHLKDIYPDQNVADWEM